MMHAFKKRTVGLTVHSSPEPSEFTTLKARLEGVQKTLTEACDLIEAVDKTWLNVCEGGSTYHELLNDGYPEDDHVKTLLKGAASHMESLRTEFAGVPDPAADYRHVVRDVKAYLSEIKALQNEYKRVAETKREYEIYHSKVESLEKRKKGGDKKARNLDKLESARATYESALKGVMAQVENAYKKVPEMYTAAYVAYWLYQTRILGIVNSHFKPSQDYAARHDTGSTLPATRGNSLAEVKKA